MSKTCMNPILLLSFKYGQYAKYVHAALRIKYKSTDRFVNEAIAQHSYVNIKIGSLKRINKKNRYNMWWRQNITGWENNKHNLDFISSTHQSQPNSQQPSIQQHISYYYKTCLFEAVTSKVRSSDNNKTASNGFLPLSEAVF